MTDYIQHIILPAALDGGVCVIGEVYSNETRTKVSLVTIGSSKPALKATVERIIELYPHVLRIRILTSDGPDLCSFKLIDGSWVEQLPPSQRALKRLTGEERRRALRACMVGAARLPNDD